MNNNLILSKSKKGFTILIESMTLKNALANKFSNSYGFNLEDLYVKNKCVYCDIDTKNCSKEIVVDFIDYLSKFLGDYQDKKIAFCENHPFELLKFRIDEMDKLLSDIVGIDLDTPGYFESVVKVNQEVLESKELKQGDILEITYVVDFD